jgi:hypothetical protein
MFIGIRRFESRWLSIFANLIEIVIHIWTSHILTKGRPGVDDWHGSSILYYRLELDRMSSRRSFTCESEWYYGTQIDFGSRDRWQIYYNQKSLGIRISFPRRSVNGSRVQISQACRRFCLRTKLREIRSANLSGSGSLKWHRVLTIPMALS